MRFNNREIMSQHDQETVCRCGSDLSYETCCKPYHQGSRSPENALKLMKSRYVAYALNLPEYIIRTTHPASPQYQANVFAWKRSITKFSQSQVFQKLEVVDFIEHGSFSTVVFIAHLASGHTDNTFCERSYFEKLKGHWLYKWGELIEGHEPNFSQRGQLQLLPLAYYGDPILTKQAEPIEHINEDLRILLTK